MIPAILVTFTLFWPGAGDSFAVYRDGVHIGTTQHQEWVDTVVFPLSAIDTTGLYVGGQYYGTDTLGLWVKQDEIVCTYHATRFLNSTESAPSDTMTAVLLDWSQGCSETEQHRIVTGDWTTIATGLMDAVVVVDSSLVYHVITPPGWAVIETGSGVYGVCKYDYTQDGWVDLSDFTYLDLQAGILRIGCGMNYKTSWPMKGCLNDPHPVLAGRLK